MNGEIVSGEIVSGAARSKAPSEGGYRVQRMLRQIEQTLPAGWVLMVDADGNYKVEQRPGATAP